MKATLHFEHEEQDELQDALNGLKWRLIVCDLDQELRGIVKHGYIGSREATSAEIKMADYVRTKLRQLVNDDGLNLDV